uniref:DUF148 domain-containing protein n=1 Tax=Strongyloides papillosus TaxID=174720 RepID=A0A0N5BMU4_STREA
MVLTEDKSNLQVAEESSKTTEEKKDSRHTETVTQLLKLRSDLNSVIFQRFKEKVTDEQLNEALKDMTELCEFFEKLLQESGYEKGPNRGRRYNNRYRRNYYNKKRNNKNDNDGSNESKGNDNSEDNNKENDSNGDKKQDGKKRNYRRNFRRYGNKKNSKGPRGEGNASSPDDVKKEVKAENDGSSTKEN